MATETLDGSAVRSIEALALKSGTDLLRVDLGEGFPGLPDAVPILLNRQTGQASGIRNLLDQFRTRPERKTGTANVTTLESFVELTNRHKTGDSVIFADTNWQKPSLTAVIDYHRDHSGGDADFGQHRVHYAFPLSEEWEAWMKQDGEPMSQGDFATWIEDHVQELSAPDSEEEEYYRSLFGFRVAHPNEMQILSRGLNVKVEQRVKSSITLQSGEGEIVFEESHVDGATGSKFTVPGIFILAIAPFFLGDACRIPVRLRYRVRDGKTIWFFRVHRPDRHITEQVRRDLENAANATGLPHFQGAPEA